MNNSILQIQYSDHFVAFLDVLGFKNMILRRTNNNEKVSNYFSVVKEVTNEVLDIPSKRKMQSIVISDSVILSMPVTDNLDSRKNLKHNDVILGENIRILRELCFAIRKIQYRLALEDIWMRGAVTLGDAYFNSSDNMVVGPAYISAYEIEGRIAIFPRVVIDNNIILKLCCQSANKLIEEVNRSPYQIDDYNILKNNILFRWEDNASSLSKINKDIPLFIDYLSLAFHESIETNELTYPMRLYDHLQKNIYEKSEYYQKYKWVVDYFTQVCWYNLPTAGANSKKLKDLIKLLEKL